MDTIILGIESSCDETAAAVSVNGKVITNIIATQSIHEDYGGVVPELASREHLKNIVPVVDQAIKKAGISKKDLSAVACTQGPGLLGALLVGYTFSKHLSFALGIPFINVHHMKAHIWAHFIDDPKPRFPFLCLTVSGGHTQIIEIRSFTDLKLIGETRDDAVGEAFDKGAKLLGLDYPGGPMIDKHAKMGDPLRFSFSKANIEGLDFSFSGIKTSLLYFLQKELQPNKQFVKENLNDLCASYQDTLLNMLTEKLVKASSQTGIKTIAIAGGVAANSGLRQRLDELSMNHNWHLHIPKLEYCTDNAAMIAITGHYQFLENQTGNLFDTPKARLPLTSNNE
jgi:N6-L-threonylcarbamoyladenine synthase